MFPFWQDVVAPLIEAAEARRIVEIGALRGENTELMLNRLGPDVELHVIDPVPDFDPAEHERRFAGRYVFHRDLSVNVLEGLGPVDVALIDGDHNWYTVFTELTMLSDAARRAGAAMPLMILHDVGWPYGRRDLYYDPDNIPDEHKQPWRRSGIRLGQAELAPGGGGMNASLANAELEGGPHNGVMTAVEDFTAQYDKPLRLKVVPIFFGLAILVEEERLAAQPAIAERLAWLDTLEGNRRLLELSEQIRLEGVVFDQSMIKRGSDRVGVLASRYIDTAKRILSEDEPTREGTLDDLEASLDVAWTEYARGDVATVGVASATTTAFLAAYLEARDDDPRPRFRRHLWAVDPKGSVPTRKAVRRLGLATKRTHLLDGDLPTALAEVQAEHLAAVHVGRGLSSTDVRTALDSLVPRLSPGGVVSIEDRSDPAVAAAVDQYRADHGTSAPLEPTEHGGARWRVG